MIEEHNNHLSCIGYAGFLKKLQNKQEPLFAKLQSDVIALSEGGATNYPRLTEIQHALIDILNYLDPEYIRFPKERRSYVPSNT